MEKLRLEKSPALLMRESCRLRDAIKGIAGGTNPMEIRMDALIFLAVAAVIYYFAAQNGYLPKFWERKEDE